MPTASKDAAGWQVAHTIAAAGEKVITFKTENRFIDADARVTITTPSASNPTLSLTDKTSGLSMGIATSGVYSPTIDVNGNATISTAGWIVNNDYAVAVSNLKVGTVNQSIIQNGQSTIASGSTITPGPSEQTINITEGYNSARTLIIGSASSSSPGAVTSGTATISTLQYAYVSADQEYTISGSANVSAPTVDVAGYVSGSIGTLNENTNGATVAATVPAITLSSTLSGATTARKPTLTKQTISTIGVTDASSGEATVSAPISGVYVAVRSNANTASINSAPAIAAAGYGVGSNFVEGTKDTAIVGAAQSDIYYVPITTTSATVSGRNVIYGTGWITGGTSSVNTGTITSGAGVATISAPSWDNGNSNFVVTASGSITAPTVNTAGYISTTEGTLNGNSISGSASLDVVQVGVNVTGTAKVTPTISRTAKPSGDTWVDAASGAATTTKPTSGAYVQVNAAGKTNDLTITGKVTSEGYGSTAHYNTDTATTTTVGSNAAAATYVPIKAGSVTSGNASVSELTFTELVGDDGFFATGQETIPAPTFTEGYISSTVGTKTGGQATVGAIVPMIELEVDSADDLTSLYVTPQIQKTGGNIPQAGNITTTAPSGYYIGVQSTAVNDTCDVSPIVVTAGYGSEALSNAASTTVTYGSLSSGAYYIPISEATFANTATSGVTYTDISSSGPVLISGDYLYINAGYTPAKKISLARLVPDASDENAPANYILAGYTAYDNDGQLLVGTMATYDGTYTIV